MSYAIIRNEKYTKDQMIKLAPHNEGVKKEYSNKNIDMTKTYQNYHLKKPQFSNYFKEFKRLKEENNLKGQLHKNSIYACEMIITSDKYFFMSIGEKETKRYFQTAYEFVCNFNNLGEENIISAVVHMDEETPHMHITYIPVVDSKDKHGNNIRKIGGYDFWKERNSYMKLQDDFYEYVSLNGFNLERGKPNPNRNYKTVEELKELTNFYEGKKIEKEFEDTLSPIYTSIKSFMNYEEFTPESVDQKILQPLLHENNQLNDKIKQLKIQISNIESAINQYNDLQVENESLKSTIEEKQKEIDILYNLIVRLNGEKEKLIEELKKNDIQMNDYF